MNFYCPLGGAVRYFSQHTLSGINQKLHIPLKSASSLLLFIFFNRQKFLIRFTPVAEYRVRKAEKKSRDEGRGGSQSNSAISDACCYADHREGNGKKGETERGGEGEVWTPA